MQAATSLRAERALRATAIVIALAAAIDPAVTSSRRSKLVIAVVAGEPRRDSALAVRVARALAADYSVIPARFPRADATVVVGDGPPAGRNAMPAPVFAVRAGGEGASVVIGGVDAPAWAPIDSRVPVTATLRTESARGRVLDVTLRAGDAVVDHVSRTLTAADSSIRMPLTVVPTAVGAVPLRLTATLSGDVGSPPASDSADASTVVRDRRWAVLFFEPRPSWMTTFVRRALERDPRFLVTSRTVTSGDVGRDAGRAPHRLDDLATLEQFDAVVVGAPESLGERDVSGLDAFLRRRGGAAVLLLDRRERGPWERLASASTWSESSALAPYAVAAAGDTSRLRATELTWPTPLPPGAEAVALTAARGSATSANAIVWRSSVGAGRLVVSGALDAWRFRDPAVSAFERFWQETIADAANASPSPLAMSITPSVVAPGGTVEVGAVMRDAALQRASEMLSSSRTVRARVAARVENARGAAGGPDSALSVIRLWPAPGAGRLHGTFRAPDAPGVHRVVVTSDGQEAEMPLVVSGSARLPSPDRRELLRAWTSALGGRVFTAAEIGLLPAALRAALTPAAHLGRWRPMQSAWWLLPFTLALAAEWWLRRRRGLA